jgi:hypothetical protein
VVSVCDIYGNVSLAEVRDGSRRITTQSEFYRCNPHNVNLEYDPSKATLIQGTDVIPVLSQTSSTSSTEILTRSYWIGQTFIPHAPGISRVHFGVTIIEPSRFRVEVRTSLPGGFPDDNPEGLLGASSTDLIEASGEISVTFQDLDELILDGRPYVLIIKILSGSAEIRLSTQNPYPDGLLIRAYSLDWITIPEFDCLFKIYDQEENLSIDQSGYDSDAYISESGYYVTQTLLSPIQNIKAIELDITEADPDDIIQLQVRKTLSNGFPDFAYDSLLLKRDFTIGGAGLIQIPLKWNIPTELMNKPLAFTCVSPQNGSNSIRLGHTQGNPYPDGEVYVSTDLIDIDKLQDHDLYFQILAADYTSVTSGTLVYEFDAGSIVKWTGVEIMGDASTGCAIRTRYRFAKTREELENIDWGEYYEAFKFDFSESHTGRFMQCEIHLESSGTDSPSLDSFEIFYRTQQVKTTKGFLVY